MGLIVGTVIGLILIDLLIHLYAVRIGLPLFESPLPFAPRTVERDPHATDFEFASLDGRRRLKGSYLAPAQSPPTALILFCHELDGNRWTAGHYGEGLLLTGCGIVTFDFCNHGESESREGYRPLNWLTEYEVDDVLSAIAHVRKHPEWSRLPLVLFGVSKGAGAALAAAGRSKDVQGIIVESAYSTPRLMSQHVRRWLEYVVGSRIMRWVPQWHIELTLTFMRLVSQWRRKCRFTALERDLRHLKFKPQFWICGGRDNYVTTNVVRDLCRLAGGDPETDVWVVKKARHNSARLESQSEYDRHLADFVARIVVQTPVHRDDARELPVGASPCLTAHRV